jgi:hypothetical protein
LSSTERVRPSSYSFVSQEANSVGYTMTIRISKQKAVRFITDDQALFFPEFGRVLDRSSEVGRRRDQRSQSREFEDVRRNRNEQKKSLEVREGARRIG